MQAPFSSLEIEEWPVIAVRRCLAFSQIFQCPRRKFLVLLMAEVLVKNIGTFAAATLSKSQHSPMRLAVLLITGSVSLLTINALTYWLHKWYVLTRKLLLRPSSLWGSVPK